VCQLCFSVAWRLDDVRQLPIGAFQLQSTAFCAPSSPGEIREVSQKSNQDHRLGTLTSPVPDRVLDLLRCGRDKQHDVRIEWVVSGGVRTGGTFAYCYDCRTVIPVAPPPAPATWSWQRKRAGRRNNSGAPRRRTKS
jgi:hypothetical protein